MLQSNSMRSGPSMKGTATVNNNRIITAAVLILIAVLAWKYWQPTARPNFLTPIAPAAFASPAPATPKPTTPEPTIEAERQEEVTPEPTEPTPEVQRQAHAKCLDGSEMTVTSR